MRQVKQLISINGVTASRHVPSIGKIQAQVPLGDTQLLNKAVDVVKNVQPEWAAIMLS